MQRASEHLLMAFLVTSFVFHGQTMWLTDEEEESSCVLLGWLARWNLVPATRTRMLFLLSQGFAYLAMLFFSILVLSSECLDKQIQKACFEK